MSSFDIFLIWYLASMLISFPLAYQWISYLLKEHRRKEIGKRYPSTTKAIRAEVKIGPPLEFSAGADDFELTEKGVSVVQELEITINSEKSPLWMNPPTPEHNRVIMPRGMGGSSSPLHARDIDPLVQTAIDFHRTTPLFFSCWKNVPGCFCKTGYAYEKLCPECRDEPDRDMYSFCVCPPKETNNDE